MNLKKKLKIIFLAMGMMVLIITGVTYWCLTQWKDTNRRIEEHYQRSLLLMQVRSSVFSAYKELADALTGDEDARDDFEVRTQSVTVDLERWALLAFTDEERAQVTNVRSTYMNLLAGTKQFFDLVEKRQLKKAMVLMEDDLEKIRFTKFEGVTEEAVLSDQTYRSSVNTHIQTIRQSAEIMLAIATFACISLILLVLGYLTSDIFAPIKELNLAMKAIKQHNYKYRLSEARKDELGDVNRTFNKMVQSIAQREHAGEISSLKISELNKKKGVEEKSDSPSVTIHRVLLEIKDKVDDIKKEFNEIPKPKREELDLINETFNEMIQALSQREEDGRRLPFFNHKTENKDLNGLPWVTMHKLVLKLHDKMDKMYDQLNAGYKMDASLRLLSAELEEIIDKILRFSDFGLPIELNLAPVDIRSLLYEVVLRFHDTFVHRSIGFEINMDPGIKTLTADRAKLREVIGEVMGNAISGLPERGGHIGLRATLIDSGRKLLLEVADDGTGSDHESTIQSLALSGSIGKKTPMKGLALSKSIVEYHGGDMCMQSEPDKGTYVTIALPTMGVMGKA